MKAVKVRTMTPLVPSPEALEGTDDASMAAIRATLGQIIGGRHAANMLEVTMAALVDGATRESSEPDWTGLVGPPSCGKTEVIRACRNSYSKSIDTVASAASFNSGARDRNGMAAVPLVGELHGSTLLIKDMSSMLSEDPRKAKAILGTLTNVFDGDFDKGVGTSFSGSAIQSAKCRMAMVFGATLATWHEHSQIVAGTGTRCLMYVVPDVARGRKQFRRGRDAAKDQYRASLRTQVIARLQSVITERSDISISDAIEQWLETCASFAAVGRTPIRSERIVLDGRTVYDENPGEPEGPYRVYQQLRTKLINLCRLNGHAAPTAHEVGILQHLAVSSILLGRAQILLAVLDQETFTEAEVATKAALSRDTAQYRLGSMQMVGLLERNDGRGYRIAEEFQAVRILPEIE